MALAGEGWRVTFGASLVTVEGLILIAALWCLYRYKDESPLNSRSIALSYCGCLTQAVCISKLTQACQPSTACAAVCSWPSVLTHLLPLSHDTHSAHSLYQHFH